MIRMLTAIIVTCILLLSGSMFVLNLPENIHRPLLLASIGIVLLGLVMLCWKIIPRIVKVSNSEKKLSKINELLQESENRFRSAFDHAAIGMALISLQGNYLRVNKAICKILGYEEKELLKMQYVDVIHAEDASSHHHHFQDLLQGKMRNYHTVQRYVHKNGEIIWIDVNTAMITNEHELPLYFITQLQNITAEKTAEEKLMHMAYHDPLTGLYNRNKLEMHLQEILSTSSRHRLGFAVIFMDLDRFKFINDTTGHDIGDMLLQIVAKRLKKNIRSTDLSARVGGDEFILVLTEINKADLVASILEKVLHSLKQPILIKGSEMYVTASVGISVFPYDGEDIQTLMKNADLALYRAKELGRNNYQFCTPEMTAKAQQKMAKQSALLNAFIKNEFELFYQPIMDVSRRHISGVEALLRWHNEKFKNVDANEIVQLAEESGLIIALNEWVLKNACEQLKKWHRIGHKDLMVSVNVSARQFKQAMFIENLLKILEQTGISPEFLELEITEALIMQDPEYVLKVLHDLKKYKIQIAIDDFGTGYSSLDYLRRFAIDKIKIDRTFVQRITTDATSCSVVTAIIAMANKLGIKMIAEGVETAEQYEFLEREKCTEIQGYYLCVPDDAATITAFLEQLSPVSRS